MDDHASLSVENRKLKEIRFRISRDALIGTGNFPGFIRQKRRETELKQKELAHLLGVTKNNIYEWVNGKGFPSEDLLVKIYDFLS